MRSRFAWGIAVLLPLAFAGCLVDAATETTLKTSAAGPEGSVSYFEINWTGHSLAGAFGDPWAHWSPPEEYMDDYWLEGFQIHTDQVAALEFEIDWRGVPESRIIFMAHFMNHTAPDADTMLEYNIVDDETTDALPRDFVGGTAKQGIHCMRVPSKDFPLFENIEGLWQPMYHVTIGAQVEAKITVRVWAAEAAIVDGPHGHHYSFEEFYGPMNSLANPRPYDECTGTLDAGS